MKKVCIITLYGNWNYGNKLQNYALQQVLKNLDCDVISLKNKYQMPLCDKLRSFYYKLRQVKKYYYMSKRENSFKDFNKNYMNYTKYSATYTLNKNKANLFDYFVIGSDQVWNYGDGTISDIMFGLFTNKEKNISYAASFGVSSIPEKYKKIYIKGLNNIENISVREKAGADIVNNITGREASVVLDPTILLEKKDWEKIEKKPTFNVPKKYLLTYFLGNVSVEKTHELNEFAKKHNLEIINLNNQNYPDYFKIGPSEFLYLIHNSSIVFTDSFHACVFSFIYNKSFYVYQRDENVVSMNSRIENLLSLIKEDERQILSIKTINNEEVFKCNYKKGYDIIKKEKKKSIDFLIKSLK
ncbi:MAG: polysaccharide pyruvyl transferase family protein [Firmicutes bacterium]|nr:polysaccharide pyruvyl transferase family protein [Bacillota bacterium]